MMPRLPMSAERVRSSAPILSMVYNDILRDSRVARMSDAIGRDTPVEVLSVAPERRTASAPGEFELTEIRLDPRGRFPRSKYIVYWLRALLHAIPRRYSAVHCHDVYPLVPAVIVAWLKRIPLIYDAHELVDHVRLRPTLIGRFWDLCHRLAIRKADYVITPNESRALFLVERGYSPRRPPLPIMNIPDFGEVPGASSATRAEFGLSADDIVVIYQGWIADDRFSTDLVEAFSLLPHRFRLLLVGDGPAMPRVHALLAQDPERRVIATGYVPKRKVVEYLGISDMGIILYDGRVLNNYYCAPNKLFDYINAGIPIVANDLPELRRVVEAAPGVGVIAAGTDAPALASAILDAHRLPAGSTAFEELRARHTWSGEAEKLRRFYAEEVLGLDPVDTP